jgi:hypothetical protein
VWTEKMIEKGEEQRRRTNASEAMLGQPPA